MIVLITGGFCVGKDLAADTLIEISSSNGLHADMCQKILSYTTRKPRFEKEMTHKFCSFEDYENFKKDGEIIAETKINDNYYFTIKEQFDPKKINLYVVDDKGVKDIIESNIDDTYILEIVRPKWLINCPEERVNRTRQSESYQFSPDFCILNDGDEGKLRGYLLSVFDEILKFL